MPFSQLHSNFLAGTWSIASNQASGDMASLITGYYNTSKRWQHLIEEKVWDSKYSLNIESKGFFDEMDMEHESEKNAKDDSKAAGPRKLKERAALN